MTQPTREHGESARTPRETLPPAEYEHAEGSGHWRVLDNMGTSVHVYEESGAVRVFSPAPAPRLSGAAAAWADLVAAGRLCPRVAGQGARLMAEFLMAIRIDPGQTVDGAETEMVVVEHQLDQVRLELDDGTRLWFDRHELAELVEDPDAVELDEHDDEREEAA